MQSPLKIFTYLIALLFAFSCTSSKKESTEREQTEKVIPEMIRTDGGIKSFPLNEETAVDYNSRFKVKNFDGKEYFSFANRPLTRIYEFDFQTEEPTKVIALAKDGPNAVNLFFNIRVYTDSRDSIFVVSGGFGYYLINDKGEVLNKFGMGRGETNYNPRCCPINFSSATFFQDGKIFGPKKFSTQDEKESYQFAFASIGLENQQNTDLLPRKSFLNNSDEILSIERNKDLAVVRFSADFYYENNTLFAASPISDTVYLFQDFQKVDQFYVRKSDIQLADYESFLMTNRIEKINNGVQRISETDQPPHYADLLVSPNGQMVYRILIEETTGRFIENLEREIPEVAKASVVAHNLKTKQTFSFELPVAEIEVPLMVLSRAAFATNEGIFFQTEEQVSEDRLDFRFFKISTEVTSY